MVVRSVVRGDVESRDCLTGRGDRSVAHNHGKRVRGTDILADEGGNTRETTPGNGIFACELQRRRNGEKNETTNASVRRRVRRIRTSATDNNIVISVSLLSKHMLWPRTTTSITDETPRRRTLHRGGGGGGDNRYCFVGVRFLTARGRP